MFSQLLKWEVQRWSILYEFSFCLLHSPVFHIWIRDKNKQNVNKKAIGVARQHCKISRNKWEGKKWDLAEWLERLTANAVVATVLGSIPASSDTVESEGRQMKQCWISYIKKCGWGRRGVRLESKAPPPPLLPVAGLYLRRICVSS
jgi:hypothetical protein